MLDRSLPLILNNREDLVTNSNLLINVFDEVSSDYPVAMVVTLIVETKVPKTLLKKKSRLDMSFKL